MHPERTYEDEFGHKFRVDNDGRYLGRAPVEGSPVILPGFTPIASVKDMLSLARSPILMQSFVKAVIRARGGNPTIMKNGKDLFRLRADGHGFSGANVTPFIERVNPRTGQKFINNAPDEAFNWEHFKALWKALQGRDGYSLRNLGGR
jgi:hypothetical protein